MTKATVIAFALLSVFHLCFAQKKQVTKIDSGPKSTVKPYSQIVTSKTISKYGLITVHQADDKYYFEIADSLLEKDLLLVTRLSRSASFIKAYPGDIINNEVIRFERAPNNRLFIRKIMFVNYGGDSTSQMYKAVERSSLMPVIASFPIAAFGVTHGSALINVTDYLLGDNELFSLIGQQKGARVTDIDPDKSFVAGISAFPENIEIRTQKSFGYTTKSEDVTNRSTLTLELNTSVILLPKHPWRSRREDIRVGYFSQHQVDFDHNPQGVNYRSSVYRWRLEPKPEDIDKYQRGELVEPKKQIVFYIDPATPEKWVPYLMAGVNDWQKAFEQAGFKNAICAKRAPTPQEDPDWSIDDARHSVIVYKPSEIENAVGPSICDPRTGEILESHIEWYHNIMQLLHDQYMVSCAAVDPAARKITFPDTLMGKLIRYAISHEVGHTLGLTHNFISSSTIPVDSLRRKGFVNKNGVCPSVMDYARFNYIAQPEDGLGEDDLIAKIGRYDRWAIEWGYRWYPDAIADDQITKQLIRLTTNRLTDKRLLYSYNDESRNDPRKQMNDLGDDAVKAGNYGIANLKRIMPHLMEWTTDSEQSYKELKNAYDLVIRQYSTYIRHVSRYIGGSYETITLSDQGKPIYAPVEKSKQYSALDFVDENFLKTPYWLIDTALCHRTGLTPIGIHWGFAMSLLGGELIGAGQKNANILSNSESMFGDQSLSLKEYLDILMKGVFEELYDKKPVDIYRRSLQQYFLKEAILYMVDDDRAWTGASSGIFGDFIGWGSLNAVETMFGKLLEIQRLAREDLKTQKDPATRYHLEYIDEQINRLKIHKP